MGGRARGVTCWICRKAVSKNPDMLKSAMDTLKSMPEEVRFNDWLGGC